MKTPAVVILTEHGARDRVLNGIAGMIMPVASTGEGFKGRKLYHVTDRRYSNGETGAAERFQVWTLGPEHCLEPRAG